MTEIEQKAEQNTNEETRTAVTEEEYVQVKNKLETLTNEYKEQIDLMAREAQVLSVIRSQINICLELIATYEENREE